MATTARDLLPALAAADAALAAHAATRPVGDGYAVNPFTGKHTLTDERAAWDETHDALTAARDAAQADARPLLCSKCDGRGRVQWKRCGKVCFQCKGDGWSAKGRRQHATNA